MSDKRGRGRPRIALDTEIAVVERLSRGVPGTRIAAELGICRNTVCDVKKRNQGMQVLDLQREVEKLQEEKRKCDERIAVAEKQRQLARYQFALDELERAKKAIAVNGDDALIGQLEELIGTLRKEIARLS